MEEGWKYMTLFKTIASSYAYSYLTLKTVKTKRENYETDQVQKHSLHLP